MRSEADAFIARACAEALPQEAVGWIWRAPGRAEAYGLLTNLSDDPGSSYAVSLAELMEKFTASTGSDIVDADEGDIVLWHSHPSGLVGPSRGDMRAKLEGLRYMVVTLTDDGAPLYTEF